MLLHSPFWKDMREKRWGECGLFGTAWTCGQDGVMLKLSVWKQKHSDTVHQRWYLNMQRGYKGHPKKAKQKGN